MSSSSSSSVSDEGLFEEAPARQPIILPPIPMSFSESDPEVNTIENTIEMQYLQVPKPQKMFLISPPASPPLGWEHSIEQAPVIAHRDLGNLKSILDAKTPKEYYETVYGSNPQQQDEMMAKVVAKLSLYMQRNVETRIKKTETKITDIIINSDSMNIDDENEGEGTLPRPALLIEFQEETDSLPKILIEDVEKPQSYTHSLEKLPVSMEEAGLYGERHRKQLKLTKTRIPQTTRPPL